MRRRTSLPAARAPTAIPGASVPVPLWLQADPPVHPCRRLGRRSDRGRLRDLCRSQFLIIITPRTVIGDVSERVCDDTVESLVMATPATERRIRDRHGNRWPRTLPSRGCAGLRNVARERGVELSRSVSRSDRSYAV